MLLVLTLFSFCVMSQPVSTDAAPIPGIMTLGIEVGSLAPEFTLQDRDGNWISLSDFRGKKVFIYSWSSWCRCKYQLPQLEEFYRKNKSDNFEIIAVAADSMGFKMAQPYLDKADATFISLIDPNNELGHKYNFWATENGFFVDESGVIRLSEIGFYIYKDEHRQLLENLLNTDFKVEEQKLETRPLAERIATAIEDVHNKPGDITATMTLGELYRQDGNLNKAEKVYRAAIKKKRFNSEAHFRLGVVLYQQGQIEEAVREWKKARWLEPSNYVYMRNVQAYTKPDKFYSELAESK